VEGLWGLGVVFVRWSTCLQVERAALPSGPGVDESAVISIPAES